MLQKQNENKLFLFFSTRERVDASERTRLESFRRGFGYSSTPSRLKGPLYVHQLSFLNRNQDYFLFNFQLVLKILYGLSIATPQENNNAMMLNDCLKKIVYIERLSKLDYLFCRLQKRGSFNSTPLYSCQ